jgi:predicted enzyme related to lactoylglutathione lyase
VAGNIVHFEFPAEDAGRSTAFWGSLFDWTFEQYGDSGYHMTQTPQPGGAIQSSPERQTGITVYFATDDVVTTSEKVAALGGKVVMAKSPVPSMGYFAICEDTEGNTFGLWESDESAEAPS